MVLCIVHEYETFMHSFGWPNKNPAETLLYASKPKISHHFNAQWESVSMAWTWLSLSSGENLALGVLWSTLKNNTQCKDMANEVFVTVHASSYKTSSMFCKNHDCLYPLSQTSSQTCYVISNWVYCVWVWNISNMLPCRDEYVWKHLVHATLVNSCVGEKFPLCLAACIPVTFYRLVLHGVQYCHA